MKILAILLFGAMVWGAQSAMAEGVVVSDAYARSASPQAKSGAAFMVLHNDGSEDDRLISASSDIAHKVELHTHKQSSDGMMQMLHVPEGFVIPAGSSHALARGGDHVMLMGLKTPLGDVDSVTVILTFEKAGEMVITVPVDMAR